MTQIILHMTNSLILSFLLCWKTNNRLSEGVKMGTTFLTEEQAYDLHHASQNLGKQEN